MEETFREIASSLVAISRSFYARGWVLGTSGNFSAVLTREPLRLAITASGADKGELNAEQIVVVGREANQTEDSASRPSAEALLHVNVVLQRGAGAVLHTHFVWSTVLSNVHAAAGGIPIEGFEMLKGLEGVNTHEHREWLPIVENSQDMRTLAETCQRFWPFIQTLMAFCCGSTVFIRGLQTSEKRNGTWRFWSFY